MVKFIKNVPQEVSDEITPDFIVGPSACVIYAELTYHLVYHLIPSHLLHFLLVTSLCPFVFVSCILYTSREELEN